MLQDFGLRWVAENALVRADMQRQADAVSTGQLSGDGRVKAKVPANLI